MCNCLKRTDATEPTATLRSSRNSRLSKCSSSMSQSQDSRTSPISPSISSAEHSISRSRSSTSSAVCTSGSINKGSSRASISSKTSLSSIRESLPDNPNIYDFSEICAATNNLLAKRFSSSSAVWRCSLHGKDAIVIQRRLRRSMEASMLRERLSLICRSHHSSLIKLLGASISGDHIYLVYEYVNGVSLADCLRNPKNPNFTVLSNWMSRMKVAIDIAQGLDYIHNSFGFNQNFVHNHIRSTGLIVTDQPSFHARICHFGTAELCGEIPEYHDQHQEGKLQIADNRSMRFEGTRGYMSPEFQATGIGTQKSDVFAFGVVLLELLSGEEPFRYRLDEEKKDYRRVSLIEMAREAMEEEKDVTGKGEEEGEGGRTGWLRRWVDRRLKDSFPVEVVEKMTRVALDCVDVDPGRRPNMRDVAGKISKLYLKSERWSNSLVGLPTGITVSLAPR
ncbi:lysM domain receptor-like kinase 3 isoform X2 [Telopea speciosissima]|uniref:lysM domain receptor-like kinase 3 isoform X2 n=1 Tax=Telopea speciosissima TaxID=54955 RepID=UPI001CC36385|nr:lysM domain receptor-like kinase 3 isoform X2 [Telopea speciosissima]